MKKIKDKDIAFKEKTDKGLSNTYLPKLFKFNRIRKLISKKVNRKD